MENPAKRPRTTDVGIALNHGHDALATLAAAANQGSHSPGEAAVGNDLALRPLSTDAEVFGLLNQETERQRTWLNLIASENYTSRAVLEALSSVAVNKYSEGYPGARLYGGNKYIDQIELLAQQRALDLFGLDKEQWAVNVQTLGGTQANSQVYHALMKPHDRLMGLSLNHGGHMSFGYQTDRVKVSIVSTFYETMPFRLNLETGRIDYDDLESIAMRFRPKVIIAGASSYCRTFDYPRLRSICNMVNAHLVVDMAHTAGIVAAGLVTAPFEYADVVTAATHKSLRGPRGAMIICKKELEPAIRFSVFPAIQGGPHNHTIAAMAVALGQAATPEFKSYASALLSNCQILGAALKSMGYTLVSGGSDVHMLVVSLMDRNVDGSRVTVACEYAKIAVSATAVPGDLWYLPRAIRLGTTALTTRNLPPAGFKRAAELVDRVIRIAVSVQESLPADANKLKDFKAALPLRPELEEIGREVSAWIGTLPMPC